MIPLASLYAVIVEDFDEELTSLKDLVQIAKTAPPRTRVATIHATTLILAAAFEEFIRQMARAYAVQVVKRSCSISDVPNTILTTAWKRTFEEISSSKWSEDDKRSTYQVVAKRARVKIDALCAFMEGDISQDIFDSLIHNERNMRVGEINRMFKISGLSNICMEICKQESLKQFFGQEDGHHTHGHLLSAIKRFIDLRNEIAHSLNPSISNAPEEVFRLLDMFRAFAKDLSATLEADTE